VDAVRGLAGEAPEEDDCTAVITPDSLSGGHGFLAQTWDMHDSATEHVVLLDIEPIAGPRAFVFSTVGCLGQIGLNEAGIAVGINNLTAARGSLGVTWPLVVRKVLAQTDIETALACVTEAELAGAHNYLLLDRHGRGYNVEAMPGRCSVRKLDDSWLVHTNHCIDASTRSLEAQKAPALLESSRARLTRAEELLAARGDGIDAHFLMELSRDPVAICQLSRAPHHIESSGAVIMRPASRELHAVWGLPSENEYERFVFEG
jgi:isopenicillin-N N-acyltransferase-like protein